MASRLLITALLSSLACSTVHAEDATDKLARRAVDRFLDAYKASDIDAIMSQIDLPWFHNAKAVFKDRLQVKSEFEKDLGRGRNLAVLQHKIQQIANYRGVRDKLSAEERTLADEVIRDNDRVVLVLIGRDAEKDKGDKVVFLVRIKDGQAKVVGIKD